jgi:hypothetical protein
MTTHPDMYLRGRLAIDMATSHIRTRFGPRPGVEGDSLAVVAQNAAWNYYLRFQHYTRLWSEELAAAYPRMMSQYLGQDVFIQRIQHALGVDWVLDESYVTPGTEVLHFSELPQTDQTLTMIEDQGNQVTLFYNLVFLLIDNNMLANKMFYEFWTDLTQKVFYSLQHSYHTFYLFASILAKIPIFACNSGQSGHPKFVARG